jgi:hypothetical protein
MKPSTVQTLRRRPDELVTRAFLPLHKAAFGMATGLASGLIVFFATAVYLLRDPHPGFDLSLLEQFFAGYSVSWPGAFVGAAWGGFSGFIVGWFFAFSRNLLVGLTIFLVRRRAEWEQTKDFLDHL